MLANLPSSRWRIRLLLLLVAATALLSAAATAQAGGPLTSLTNLQDPGANCSLTVAYSWSGWHNTDAATVTISDDDGDRSTTSVAPGEAGVVSVTLTLAPAPGTHTIVADGHLTRNGKTVGKSSQSTTGFFQCT